MGISAPMAWLGGRLRPAGASRVFTTVTRRIPVRERRGGAGGGGVVLGRRVFRNAALLGGVPVPSCGTSAVGRWVLSARRAAVLEAARP